jgi:chromosomal replication initiator protein
VIHSDTEIVSVFRSCLRDRLGADRFDLWFATAAIQADGHRLTIAVETPFLLERIRKSFHQEVRYVAVETLGADAEIEFVLTQVKPSSLGLAEQSPESGPSVDNQNAGPIARVKSAAPSQTARRKFASLDTLVAGPCNRLACRSADLVLEQLGRITPFFVYGPSGSGKSHLLEGIWTAIRRANLYRRVVYLSSEQFTNGFVQALKGGGLPGFRQKYRNVDLLIIDDVQFFAGKQATLIELLYTMDAVLHDGGQIVLSADKSPHEMPRVGQELITRLASGLVCEMQALDVETRLKILTQHAQARQLDAAEDALRELAELAPGDGRQLAGALNRLWVQSKTTGRSVDVGMVRDVAAELFPSSPSLIRLGDIERTICREFGIAAEMLKSDKRTRNVSHPRMLAMWLARKYTRAGLGEISEFFGRKSHSTVVSAQNTVEEWVANGRKVQCMHATRDVRDLVRSLEQSLKTG